MSNQSSESHLNTIARARELRQAQTPAETKLWARLRNHQLDGYQIRRQHPIGNFFADFYCDASRLIIEIDGASHDEQADYDAARTEWLEQRDYHVIRFTNTQVNQELDAVLETILSECRRHQVRSHD